MTVKEASAAAYTGVMHQTDSKWLDYKYDDVGLCFIGCGVFALANAVGYLTGRQMDVVQVADWAYAKGYFNGEVGTYGIPFYREVDEEFGPLYGFNIGTSSSGGAIYGSIYDDAIKTHLLAGGTVVIHVPNHYMALVGYNSSNGKYHVYNSTPGTIDGTSYTTGDQWVTAEQLNTGDSKVDCYWLVYPAPQDSEKPVISNIKVTDVTCSGYTVSCTVTDNYKIAKVAFPSWSLANNQDDLPADFLNTELGTKNGNTYTFRVDAAKHNLEAGYYTTHIYAVDALGNTTTAGVGNVQVPEDKQEPVITDVEYTQVSASGYTISCTVKDNWDIDKVAFPTWTLANGQDDLKSDWWNTQKGTRNGDRFTFRVNASDHKKETGDYVTHIYALDLKGNKAVLNLPSVKVMDDKEAPKITDAVISNVTIAGYTVTCKVTDNWGLRYVAFPSWTTANGQDDLAADFINTQRGVKDGDTYTFRVRVTEHNGERGNYTTHIYAEDGAGNVTTISVGIAEVPTKETWLEKACFEPSIYRARNKDLADMTDEQLKEHWLIDGIREGRTASVILDLKYYQANNSDLKAKYGNDYAALYKHFITAGYKEHRKSSPVFDGGYYTSANSDVAQAYPDSYLQHYVEKGMNEGRRASKSFDHNYYWYLKPEVVQAHPNDYGMCTMHYVAYGYAEGLPGSDLVKPVISDVVISNVSAEGYTVSCKVTDNWGVSKVAFPSWTLNNDQDDLPANFMQTQQGTKNGNTYTFQVKASAHNNEIGMYVTHIYAVDKGGNQVTLNLDPVDVRDDPQQRLTLKDSAAYRIERTLLTGVKPSTKVSTLVNQFESLNLEVLDHNGNKITGNTRVGTGATIKLYKDGKLSDTLTVVVPGDLTGDGVMDTTDYMRAKASMLGTVKLSDAAARAADVDGNGTADTTDYIRMKTHLMGAINIYG